MSDDPDATIDDTIDLLESRLRRVDYVIHGHYSQGSTAQNKDPAMKRLQNLELSMRRLTSKHRVIQDLINLHARYADLFSTPNVDTSSSSLATQAIVLASASTYHLTASRLTSVLDSPLPSADLSAGLINLLPRLEQIGRLQDAQAAEVAVLQRRTAVLLQRWYAVSVLGSGECWAELESRVELLEQRLRRANAQQASEI